MRVSLLLLMSLACSQPESSPPAAAAIASATLDTALVTLYETIPKAERIRLTTEVLSKKPSAVMFGADPAAATKELGAMLDAISPTMAGLLTLPQRMKAQAGLDLFGYASPGQLSTDDCLNLVQQLQPAAGRGSLASVFAAYQTSQREGYDEDKIPPRIGLKTTRIWNIAKTRMNMVATRSNDFSLSGQIQSFYNNCLQSVTTDYAARGGSSSSASQSCPVNQEASSSTNPPNPPAESSGASDPGMESLGSHPYVGPDDLSQALESFGFTGSSLPAADALFSTVGCAYFGP